MPDYQKGKIYKITSGDLTYIGSTICSTLARRLSEHVSHYKQWTNGKGRNITSFQLIETGQYEITLLELCPCGSKDELNARERFHIENTNCVNKVIPLRKAKEWFEVNKETILEKQKEYYQENKEAITERQKKYRDANKERLKIGLREKKDLVKG